MSGKKCLVAATLQLVFVLIATGCANDDGKFGGDVQAGPKSDVAKFSLKIVEAKLNASWEVNASKPTNATSFLRYRYVAVVSGHMPFKGGYLHCADPVRNRSVMNEALSDQAQPKVNEVHSDCYTDLSTFTNWRGKDGDQPVLPRSLFHCSAGQYVNCLSLGGLAVETEIPGDEVGILGRTGFRFVHVNSSLEQLMKCPDKFMTTEFINAVDKGCVQKEKWDAIKALIPLIGKSCPASWRHLGGQQAFGYCYRPS